MVRKCHHSAPSNLIGREQTVWSEKAITLPPPTSLAGDRLYGQKRPSLCPLQPHWQGTDCMVRKGHHSAPSNLIGRGQTVWSEKAITLPPPTSLAGNRLYGQKRPSLCPLQPHWQGTDCIVRKGHHSAPSNLIGRGQWPQCLVTGCMRLYEMSDISLLRQSSYYQH